MHIDSGADPDDDDAFHCRLYFLVRYSVPRIIESESSLLNLNRMQDREWGREREKEEDDDGQAFCRQQKGKQQHPHLIPCILTIMYMAPDGLTGRSPGTLFRISNAKLAFSCVRKRERERERERAIVSE